MTDPWTIAGTLAAVVVVPPALIAAIYAVRAWRQGASTARVVEARYQREVEPIPRVVEINLDRTTVTVSNSGGAARVVVAIMQLRGVDGSSVWVTGGAIPAHCPGATLPTSVFRRVEEPEGFSPWSVRLAAKDMLGRWWDCNRGQLIEEWDEWWSAAAAGAGVPNLRAVETSDGQGMAFYPIGGAELRQDA